MMRKLGIILFGTMLVVSFSTGVVRSKEDSRRDMDETISEIVNAINEIIRGSVALAEAELKHLQRQLEKRGGSLQKQAEESIIEALEKALSELQELERAIKKNLEQMESRPTERLNYYRKNRDTLEKRVAEFRKQLSGFAEEVEKDCATLRRPIKKKVQEILAEMERALERMEERFNKQKEIQGTLLAKWHAESYSSS